MEPLNNAENIDTFKLKTGQSLGSKLQIDEPTHTEGHERFEEAFYFLKLEYPNN